MRKSVIPHLIPLSVFADPSGTIMSIGVSMLKKNCLLVAMRRGTTFRRCVVENAEDIVDLLRAPGIDDDLELMRVERVDQTPTEAETGKL